MADAEEDAMPRGGASGEEPDLTDETQDFRFLTTISREDASIPKRGEKDFEPHATALQSNTLAASRHAMHAALAFQRTHQPRGHTLATYHPETNMAYAYNPKGPLFVRMGTVLPAIEDPFGDDERRGQRVWLLPEEVLFLMNRGTVDVRWPGQEGLAMSLQGAYAMFLGDEGERGGGLTFERYAVYSNLKRSGYVVHRAPTWEGEGKVPGDECYAAIPSMTPPTWHVGLFNYYTSWWELFKADDKVKEEESSQGPLVASKPYRSYAEIYRRLAIIPTYDPTARFGPDDSQLATDPAFRITYHVWKPSNTAYKKSAPGPPDFRIAVVNARESAVPTSAQLSALMETAPYKPPPEQSQLYQKLKHGYKSVILAIVDQGVVSYLRLADAAFGREKLYERRGQPGGRRGGRGGRGGRGRGR
ncbi:tRNA-splicing endonuclease subunit sen54 [Saxophila tyrrhenica]|uniref:tRNA-splicing endonuclease subunit sen54 n=1 Tax=Saxophila tyrrhenica TaxID=1690608 RepID=A0AAV9NZ36_9PEZI|nr:tRNA-splicing endonuclease subunit sen54 [Saxophila tyrrhenica]